VGERLNAFRTYLNRVWHRLPPQLFEPNDANYKLVHTWLQRQFIKIVVKPLGCQIELFYGDYDCEFDEELPGGETWAPETPEYQPMEIWVNMRVFEETDSEEGTSPSYLPFDQARFELRPASWIPTG
jgi:hypothetical protein